MNKSNDSQSSVQKAGKAAFRGLEPMVKTGGLREIVALLAEENAAKWGKFDAASAIKHLRESSGMDALTKDIKARLQASRYDGLSCLSDDLERNSAELERECAAACARAQE